MTGRTTWWGKDAAWHRRERVLILGEEFGAEGPNVIDVLSCWAQEQRAGGTVLNGFLLLAREAFVTVCHARSIVERAAEIGALDDLEIDEHGRFSCRVSGWAADQERARAAARQKAKRAVDTEDSSERTDRDTNGLTVTDRDSSRFVTPSALPNQTKPVNSTPQPPEGEPDDSDDEEGGVQLVAPTKPAGARKRELDRYWVQMSAWVDEHFPGRSPRSVDVLVGYVRSRKEEPTPDAVLAFAEAAPNFAYLLDPSEAAA